MKTAISTASFAHFLKSEGPEKNAVVFLIAGSTASIAKYFSMIDIAFSVYLLLVMCCTLCAWQVVPLHTHPFPLPPHSCPHSSQTPACPLSLPTGFLPLLFSLIKLILIIRKGVNNSISAVFLQVLWVEDWEL